MADKAPEMAVTQHPNSPNPFFSFFQNLVKNLPLPLPKFEDKPGVVDGGRKGQGEMEGDGEMVSKKKVDVVRFSEKRPVIPPPLKLEAEEESESSSSPAVLWQVCSMLFAHRNPSLLLEFYVFLFFLFLDVLCVWLL